MGVNADNMELDVAIFLCACAMCLEFVAMNALCRIFEASFAMSWTAGNSLWSNFNVAFLHSLFVFFLHQ